MKFFISIFLLLIINATYAQKYIIKGKVTDAGTSQPLSFANIRIDKSTLGTAASIEGAFELRLDQGNYKIIASVLGYKSDTLSVNLNSNVSKDFALEQISIRLSEVTVLPGINPALEIIRRAIISKHERNEKLESYVFNAFTKGLVKTTQDFRSSGGSASISIGTRDTGALKITGIIENESRGYFKKPNQYKDEIIARKQTANTPSSINILTGGRLLQNFYTDDIQFFDRPLLSPIADDALDFYYYIIEDTLAIDNRNIFQISFEPINPSDAGFWGKVFIADSSFTLVKLDLHLTDAANPGRLFNKINILQQFSSYDHNIPMPIDYRIFVEGNFLGLAKFGFELNSIFYDYQINPNLDDNIFGRLVIKVMPDADKKDSTYWKTTQTIPNSMEELFSYKRIDSLEAVPRSMADNFSLLSFSWRLNDYFSVFGPLRIYSFNRVEGHGVNFGVNLTRALEKRLSGNLDLGYGFSDKKFKSRIAAQYLLGEYRTHSISFSAENSLNDLFNESVAFSKLTSTLTSWIGKYDERDYYYSRGFNIKYFGEVSEVLFLGFGLLNRTDKNAVNNSNFSFLNKHKTYNPNKNIFETRINAFTTSLRLDFRNFIEDGEFRRRSSFGDAYAIFSGDAIISNSSLLKSSLDFQLYRFTINSFFRTIESNPLNIILRGVYSNGPVPFQMMYSLPASTESASQDFIYRTLRPGDVYGDRVLSINLEQSLRDLPISWLNLEIFRKLQLNFGVHFGAAITQISEKSKNIMPHQFVEYKHPFYELGFSVGQAIFPVRIDFTWKLNYFGNNNFSVDINSPLF
ncbi:MAG: carboxypeptidase-like regulatory domain-containing protein [Melioribacteraceae bacterium]|nr:carboxypeptidase-like regulatory domain-containing protein [Melioribacteraceae bacterium]